MNSKQSTKLFNRVPKFIAGLTILAFVVLVFVGLFDCVNPIMQTQMDMKGPQHSAADCVLGKNCGMDINKHLSIWQGMFTANPNTNLLNFFASLLMVGFTLRISKLSVTSQIFSHIVRGLYYERDHRESKLYNYLVRVFKTGILQPKLFA